MFKRLLYALLLSLVIIQFIRPDKNLSAGPFEKDIQIQFKTNQTVQAAIERSCYDCHSNNTRYPWYYNIQPVAWWLQHHVDEGKSELNFNEFGSYAADKMDHKLEEIAEVIQEDEMPLKSYRLAHNNANLTEEEKKAITSWVNESRTQLKIVPASGNHHASSEGEVH